MTLNVTTKPSEEEGSSTVAKSKSIHNLKNDPDHVKHPSHMSKSHMKSMAKEKMVEGSKSEEAMESPAFEAQEKSAGIE